MTITKTSVVYPAIFLLALGLRLYGIGDQSLWYDEGLTVALVQRAPAEIVRAAAVDVHPPLYYLLLKAWVGVFGTSEAAVRSLSALCGALAALLTAVLGRRWFGAHAGVLAGVAAAVSPLGVYYGQEARMYALTSLLAVLLWLGLEWWQATARYRWLLLYALAGVAGLLTHYFFVTVVAAAGGMGLLRLVFQRKPAGVDRAAGAGRGTVLWLAVHAALGALYLPLVWGSRGSLTGWSASRETPGAALVFVDSLRAMALGPVAPPETMQWLPLFVLLLFAVALWPAPVRPWQRAMGLAWLLLPVTGLAVLSLGQPYYKPRFLLPALPAFHLLLGAGAVAFAARIAPRRQAGAGEPLLAAVERASSAGAPQPSYIMGVRDQIPAAPASRSSSSGSFTAWGLRGFASLLLLAAAQPLLHTYLDPRARRDDYRAVAQAIVATARPADAVLLLGPGQVEPLGYYLQAPLARYPLPRMRPLDPAATEHELELLARDHPRVYGVFYVPEAADPQGVIAGWLGRNAFRAARRWYGGVELAVYELGAIDAPATPLDTRFGDRLRLLDARTGPTSLQPGDAVRVELHWQATAPLGPLLAFAHLLDADGRLVAQYDGPLSPTGTETWTVGQAQRGRLAVLVPPDAAPGNYRLLLGLVDARGARLTLADGTDTLTLAGLRVDR